MITLHVKKKFTSVFFADLLIAEAIDFVDREAAFAWLEAMKTKKDQYKIVSWDIEDVNDGAGLQ